MNVYNKMKTTPALTILIVLILKSNLFASDPIIVDTTRLDYQYYWFTGSSGQQILVDENAKVHVCYIKIFATETDSGWTCKYANITDEIRLEVPNQEKVNINPSQVFIDGAYGTPVYLFYGFGSKFLSFSYTWYSPAMAKLNNDGTEIEPLELLFEGSYTEPLRLPIGIEVDHKNGIVHTILSDPCGHDVLHLSFDGTNFGDVYSLMWSWQSQGGWNGCNTELQFRRNGTRGADIAVSPDGSEVTIATLHPAQNVYLFKGTSQGKVWPDSFETGLASGSIIALYDTLNSDKGLNIPNNDPKPFTEVQVDYDDEGNLHVVFDATYIDVYLDTIKSGYWIDHEIKRVRKLLFGGAGDTNAVFYDGSVHPKPQILYWNDQTKTIQTVAECQYPQAGQKYKWFNYGIPDSGISCWGKFYNDSPITNLRLVVNKDQQENEPEIAVIWEEMQGDVIYLDQGYYDSLGTRVIDGSYYAYMTDIKIILTNDCARWSLPYNITNTPSKDESDFSVYKDIIDNKIHLAYCEDSLPGSDWSLCYTFDYQNNYCDITIPGG